MAFTPEIKKFAKNTIIFTVIFALVIHFSWEFFEWLGKSSANAHNEATFENANINYLGTTATALSLRLGGIKPQNTPNNAGNLETISIAEVLSNPKTGQEKLISSNMTAVTAYANILQTDILGLLESSSSRSAALDNHISLLKSYYLKTQDRLTILAEQKQELKEIISQSQNSQNTAKNTLQSSYNNLDYTGVDGAIDEYLKAKSLDSRAKIYAIYIDRFEKSFNALQNKNKKILDALINNRDGIVRQSIVVIPDTGSDIVKELGLIQSEADYKAKKALE